MDRETTSRPFGERMTDLREMPKELVQRLSAEVTEPWTKIFLTEPDPSKWPPKMYEILKPYLEE